jgi:tetratricopeptide (TPR) repeat protein
MNILRTSAVTLLALHLLGSGCAHIEQAQKKQPAKEIILDPLHIGLRPDRELGLTDFDAATLFKEGVRLQQAEDCKGALPFYDRIISEFPESRYLSAAAFDSGRCLEDLGNDDDAVERYALITAKLEASKDWVDAAFRQSACLDRLSRQRESAELLARLLDRRDLAISDRIDAMVLRGEALVKLGELNSAESAFHGALRIFKKRAHDEYLDPAPAARAEFSLARLAEQRFDHAPLRLPEEQMQTDLEAKAELLLEAQAGYLRTIRYGDPEWASAAGFRIGSLYLHLHQAMEQSPTPADLSEEEIAVYREMLARKTAVLLRKALKVFEMTLELAARTRSDNEWTRAAREEMKKVEARVLTLFEPLPEPEP